MNDKRNSSIELLRIICVLMILSLHYALQSGAESVSINNIGVNTIFIQIISMYGRLACSVFALITGYYSIVSNNSIKSIVIKNITLLVKLIVYSWLILAIFLMFGTVSLQLALKSFLPFIFENWYIKYYILFSLFIPFINPWLVSLEKAKYQYLVLISVIVWSIIPTLTINNIDFSCLDFFIVMYVIGAGIRLHVDVTILRKQVCGAILVLSVLSLALSVIAIDVLGIVLQNKQLIQKATWLKNYNSIPAVICAISLFVFFLRKKWTNKWVNSISKTSLGIYIISDNILLRDYIWNGIYPNVQYLEFPYFHFLIKIIAVFLCCSVVDMMYNKYIDPIISKMIRSGFERRRKSCE